MRCLASNCKMWWHRFPGPMFAPIFAFPGMCTGWPYCLCVLRLLLLVFLSVLDRFVFAITRKLDRCYFCSQRVPALFDCDISRHDVVFGGQAPMSHRAHLVTLHHWVVVLGKQT